MRKSSVRESIKRRSASLTREMGADNGNKIKRSFIPRRSSVAPSNRVSLLPTALKPSTPAIRSRPPKSPKFEDERNMSVASTDRPSIGLQAGGPFRYSLLDLKRPYTKDTRLLSDKGYVNQEVRKLNEFINTRGYPSNVNPKLGTMPSKKEFMAIFEFLVQIIDPYYVLINTNMEEEIITTARILGYPFSLQKSAIQNCTNSMSWEKLLGVLFWLRDLADYSSHVPMSSLMTRQDHEFHKPMSMTFLEHISYSYSCFLKTGEDTSEKDLAFFHGLAEEAYGPKEDYNQMIEEFNHHSSRKAGILAEMDFIKEMKQEIFKAQTDINNFETFFQDLEVHIQDLLGAFENLSSVHNIKCAELTTQSSELEKLENRIVQQSSEFSLEEYKESKQVIDDSVRDERSKLNAIQHELELKEINNSKQNREFALNLIQVNQHYKNILNLLEKMNLPNNLPKLELKQQGSLMDSIQNSINPLLKDAGGTIKDKAKHYSLTQYSLTEEINLLTLQKEALIQEVSIMKSNKEQRHAAFDMEKQKLEEDFQNKQLEYNLMKDELSKVVNNALPPSKTKQEFLHLQNKVMTEEKEFEHLQRSNQGVLDSITKMFQDSLQEIENLKAQGYKRITEMKELKFENNCT